MVIEAEIARAATYRRRRPRHSSVDLPLLLIFIGAESTLRAGARVGISGALSTARARNASPALGGCLYTVFTERVRWVMEDETGTGARAHD